ncbi:MAG: ribonuclease E/G [Rhodobacter sp.]|nr:ribonuclease E/G [Rhodobacter sp.]
MKGTIVACDRIGGRAAAALVIDGRLQDLILDPAPDGPPLPGTIYRAIADRPMKGQGGLFVKLPNGASGFLRGSSTAPGKPVLVQVTGFAEPGKAVPVTSKLLFKGRYAIVTPGAPGINISRRIRDEQRRAALQDEIARACPEVSGVIVRSAAEMAPDADVSAEIAQLHDLAQKLDDWRAGGAADLLHPGPGAHRIAALEWPISDIAPEGFAALGIDDMIAEIRSPRVDLPGLGIAWIEPTRALVAIDVNTGGDTSPASGLKANIALARELPRQLRCRGLGGQVVIDMAPFAKRDRRTLEQTLRRAFQADSVETALVGWTPLGHYELQRKRERLPVSAALL